MIKHMEIKEKYGLYVHIPFCISKCSYCNFASVTKNDVLIDQYTSALCKEIEMYNDSFSNVIFDTIFIGGGTPSCIPHNNLYRIIDSIYKNFKIEIKEFTVEINPGTGDMDLFSMLKKSGVNRASVGLQCANNEVLKSIGRIHNIEQFTSTINQIKNSGINNFSVDIMSGLPNQTKEDLIKSVNLSYELGAKHISMYTLKLEDDTPMKKAVNSNRITLPDQEYEYQMSLKTEKYLEELGYQKYEISNYALDNYESKHNLKYWNRIPYLGLGVASASLYNDIRFQNTNSIQTYISTINSGGYPLVDKTILTNDEIAFEIIMLTTRLTKGMEYAKYNSFTRSNFKAKYATVIANLEKEKLIKKSNTHLILTPKGMNLQNNVLLRFMK